ncbi:MAG: SRPBCC domain-containing protein [Acidobacteria bacterium]|nr:SRPBCC domain-containing protein [Acidobacteriota bacterium]
MSVKKEADGRRWVQVETEVPGTPEQVWEAIATGPGVSAWFVPTEVETDETGRPVRVISHMGPGMDSESTPTVWDPPRRFADEGSSFGPQGPVFATEWTVEAKDGDTCTVRVVHSLFSDTDDWDGQLEGIESGWPGFFVVLRLYLKHFAGKPSANVQVMGQCAGDVATVWAGMAADLGLGGATVGGRVKSPSGAPDFSGIVEGVAEHRVVVRTEGEVPRVISVAAEACGGMNLVILLVYLYGERAEELAPKLRQEWTAWVGKWAQVT